MCVVNPVSQQLLDRCEIEKNPISLQAAQALEDEYPNCSTQIYYSLALITKGSAKTLVHSVEATHGAEAWRLLLSHTQLWSLWRQLTERETPNGMEVDSLRKGEKKFKGKRQQSRAPRRNVDTNTCLHCGILGKGLPKARRSSV